MTTTPAQQAPAAAPTPEQPPEWLSQLRDIHAAPEAPFWPPAPGWWILAGLVLALLGWLAYRALRSWRVRLRRRRVAERLDAVAASRDPVVEPAAWLADINQVLKWVAIRAFPGKCEDLRGNDWVTFLSATSGAEPEGQPAFAPLASGPYQAVPEFDAAALLGAARQWVLAHG